MSRRRLNWVPFKSEVSLPKCIECGNEIRPEKALIEKKDKYKTSHIEFHIRLICKKCNRLFDITMKLSDKEQMKIGIEIDLEKEVITDYAIFIGDIENQSLEM